jgi:hypothetical protein
MSLKEPPHLIVAVVDGATDGREGRVELDVRIAVRDERLHVPRVIRPSEAAKSLNVLFRHVSPINPFERIL